MSEDIVKAADIALSYRRNGYYMPYAIGMASKLTGITRKTIAKELEDRKHRAYTPYTKDIKNINIPSEMCRECGSKLEPNQEICDLCGEDTSWIWKN